LAIRFCGGDNDQRVFEHIAKTGERWELIAFDYDGDASLIKPLLLANPHLTAKPDAPAPLVFGAGITLRVPILPEKAITAVQLPPWKRATVRG
jgi:hypothetical protein